MGSSAGNCGWSTGCAVFPILTAITTFPGDFTCQKGFLPVRTFGTRSVSDGIQGGKVAHCQHQTTKCVYVTRGGGFILAENELGRLETPTSLSLAGCREACVVFETLENARQPEVAERGFEIVGHEDVGRLDVPVSDRWIAAMQVSKSATGLGKLVEWSAAQLELVI